LPPGTGSVFGMPGFAMVFILQGGNLSGSTDP